MVEEEWNARWGSIRGSGKGQGRGELGEEKEQGRKDAVEWKVLPPAVEDSLPVVESRFRQVAGKVDFWNDQRKQIVREFLFSFLSFLLTSRFSHLPLFKSTINLQLTLTSEPTLSNTTSSIGRTRHPTPQTPRPAHSRPDRPLRHHNDEKDPKEMQRERRLDRKCVVCVECDCVGAR